MELGVRGFGNAHKSLGSDERGELINDILLFPEEIFIVLRLENPFKQYRKTVQATIGRYRMEWRCQSVGEFLDKPRKGV